MKWIPDRAASNRAMRQAINLVEDAAEASQGDGISLKRACRIVAGAMPGADLCTAIYVLRYFFAIASLDDVEEIFRHSEFSESSFGAVVAAVSEIRRLEEQEALTSTSGD